MFIFRNPHHRRTQGFTLVELMVATGIFMMTMTLMTATSINMYRSYKRLMVQNTLFEESRILMDRIVREARMNTIDYDEYFNHLETSQGGMEDPALPMEYGKYYRQYYHRFFSVSPSVDDGDCGSYDLNDPLRYSYAVDNICASKHMHEGYFSTGANDDYTDENKVLSALGSDVLDGPPDFEKDELYLMSPDGKKKIILKLIGDGIDNDENNGIDDGSPEDPVNRLGMLVLDLADVCDNTALGSCDPGTPTPDSLYYDSWVNNIDFRKLDEDPGTAIEWGFIPISPPSMSITDLRFFVSPIDDPRKEFNAYSSALANEINEARVQAQPNVTIILTVEPSRENRGIFGGVTPPSISLQTTASSRVYENVIIPFAI